MNIEKEGLETLVFAQSVLTIWPKEQTLIQLLMYKLKRCNWLYERVLQALQPYKCLVFNVDLLVPFFRPIQNSNIQHTFE